MDLLVILIIIMLLGGVGTGPWWGYSHHYGYLPSGLFGLVFIILLICLLTGRRF